MQRELQAAKQRIEELEKQLGGSATAKVDEPFSLRAEEKRQEARGKKETPRPNARADAVGSPPPTRSRRPNAPRRFFPTAWPKSDCQLSHTRPVWRLENGRAVLVAYQIYRGPNNQYGKIPGVLGRSEFGLEIVVEIAYLVYIVGLSFDKVCLLLSFFQNLRLGKVAGRRVAASVVAALAERVRGALHAAGQLVGGACRRDELEPEQRVGVSLGEGAGAVLRRAQGCRHAEGDSRSGDVRRHRDQRRRGGVRQLHRRRKSAGRICCARRSS